MVCEKETRAHKSRVVSRNCLMVVESKHERLHLDFQPRCRGG